MSEHVVLSVEGATKTFGGRTRATKALESVSFVVRQGERVAVLGRNGAGKSTLIRSIGSLVRLDGGEIRVDGQEISQSNAYLQRVGVTLEGGRNVYWRLTPYENLRYFAGLRGVDVDHARIRELIDVFEIPNAGDSEVGRLSTGNKQKVAVACALVHDPPLLLLDEPTLGLDVEAVAHIRRLIVEDARRRDRAFIITSHDLSFVEDVCERVVVLEAGRIVFDGSLAILRASTKGYTVKLVLHGSPEVAPEWADRSRAELTRTDSKLSISFHAYGPDEIFAAFDHLKTGGGASVADLDVSKTTLAVAYLNLARGARA